MKATNDLDRIRVFSVTDARPEAANHIVRKHLVLHGILQGIGCRPTIYRLAVRHGLAGWVINSTSGVHLEIEGTPEQCAAFECDLTPEIPFPGRIDSITAEHMAPLGESEFRIETSREDERTVTPIPPDVAVCDACVEELFDPQNPRYLYPFITCTLCGPRFTVVRSFPYDRERTSMADFTMCRRCRAEYDAPEDRRFHSQTNSCPDCGPVLLLRDAAGRPIEGDPVTEAIRMLADGKTLAVKGIGGFHLACDALNEHAVSLLRDRKRRQEKPFAVMMPDLETIRQFCETGDEEERLLSSPVAPIVLLRSNGRITAANVAPFVGTLGVMLPYAPLHHLLFRHPEAPQERRLEALVMTSGNVSDEPIAADNNEAIERLGDLADGFLIHNREIVLRADDSIYRVIDGRPTVFRRSRGLVPGEIALDSKRTGTDKAQVTGPEKIIMGAGGDLKNALTVIKGNRAVPGPHVGDLAAPEAQAYFVRSAGVLTEYLEARPEVYAVDPHPEYFSARLARERGGRAEEVFHHHAHAVSLLVEHQTEGPAVFAVLDGTGYGTDGTIWGGEILTADRAAFTREGHIGLFPLPGGEAAIKEPVRILAGLLAEDDMIPDKYAPLFAEYWDMTKYWLEAARKGINAPMTSSAGRLFDAAAAGAGFLRRVTFEGQAAMWLEGVSDPSERQHYSVVTDRHASPFRIDPRRPVRELADDMLNGEPVARIAARFHNTVAEMIVRSLETVSRETGIRTVGLTGGCFQNRLLTERASALLRERGLNVLLHSAVPPNDGGLALGQAVCVRHRILEPA